MSNLTFSERKILEDFLGMGTGYVSTLSNKSFHDLFLTTLNIDINNERYSINGSSKANRMRTFLNTHSDPDIAKILTELTEFVISEGSTPPAQTEKVKSIISRLSSPPNKTLKTSNQDFEDLQSIWEKNKLKIFISHRDIEKKAAKVLADELSKYGVTAFVAHDSIEPMSLWKNEIYKALDTMDGFVAFITANYYASVWTNQEIGFALAREIPVFLYSADRTDPQGFHLDTQAIKTGGVIELMRLLKLKFPNHSGMKKYFIDNFVQAVNGTWATAQERFCLIVDLEFTVDELDTIFKAFQAKAKYANQLNTILYDKISDEHKQLKSLKGFEYYREALQSKVLKQHPRKRYIIIEEAKDRFALIDNE